MKGIRHAYWGYYRKYNREKFVSEKTFLEINSAYMLFLMDTVLNGDVFNMYKLGSFYIKGTKSTIKRDKETGEIVGLKPNWKLTYDLWNKDPKAKLNKEKIFHLNEHTGGIRYKFFWSKKDIYNKYKNFYSLTLTKDNKRLLKKLIENGKEFYSE